MELPADAELLDVQVQRGRAMLWVLGDPDGPVVRRRFKGVTTGHPEPHDQWAGWRYVGTCQFQYPEGDFVLHLFAEERGRHR